MAQGKETACLSDVPEIVIHSFQPSMPDVIMSCLKCVDAGDDEVQNVRVANGHIGELRESTFTVFHDCPGDLE